MERHIAARRPCRTERVGDQAANLCGRTDHRVGGGYILNDAGTLPAPGGFSRMALGERLDLSAVAMITIDPPPSSFHRSPISSGALGWPPISKPRWRSRGEVDQIAP